MANGEGLVLLFLIGVLAVILIATVNVLAESYPEVAIAVCLFCLVLLGVLVIVALALAEGLGMGFFESIIAKATKNKPSVSVDIGLLHIPMRFAEFASLLYAGFIVQSIGYVPVFVSSGIFFAIFSVLSLYFLRN